MPERCSLRPLQHECGEPKRVEYYAFSPTGIRAAQPGSGKTPNLGNYDYPLPGLVASPVVVDRPSTPSNVARTTETFSSYCDFKVRHAGSPIRAVVTMRCEGPRTAQSAIP